MKLNEEQIKVLFEVARAVDFSQLCEIFKNKLTIEQIKELDRLLDDIHHDYEDYEW